MTEPHSASSVPPTAAEAEGPAAPSIMETVTVAPPSPVSQHPTTPLWATVGLGIVLIGGLVWVWQDRAAPDTTMISDLQASLKAAQQRIAALEQRPTAPPVDTSRIAALEKTVAELANRPAPAAPDVAGAVASASAALTARIETLDSKLQQDMADTQARAEQATRLRAATAALEAGKPLGDLPGAPPALAQFARTAPPTEPALRLSFNSYASDAEAASQPSAEGHSFSERMWMRAQTLVTVRQGNHVLVGAPAAATLAVARGKLDAGDLAGAVAAMAPLDPAATTAMAPWTRDTKALIDARAALAAMAAKS